MLSPWELSGLLMTSKLEGRPSSCLDLSPLYQYGMVLCPQLASTCDSSIFERLSSNPCVFYIKYTIIRLPWGLLLSNMDNAGQIVLYILILAKSLEPAVWLEELSMVPVTQSSYPRGLWTRMPIYVSIRVHINFRKRFQQHWIILRLWVRPHGNKTWEKKGSLNELRWDQNRQMSLVLTDHISIPSVPSVVLCTLCTLSGSHLLQRGTDRSPKQQRLAKQNLRFRAEASSVFLNSFCAVCSTVDHQMLLWTHLWPLGAKE